MAIAAEEGYDFLIDENNNMLHLSRLMKKLKEKLVANTKAKLGPEQALTKSEMSKIKKYRTTK